MGLKDNLVVFFSAIILIFSLVGLFSTYTDLKDFLTGHAINEDSGQISIVVSPYILLEFTLERIEWGEGYVLAMSNFSRIDTLGNVINGTWDSVENGFVISSFGNVNATLNLSSVSTAEEFLGGSSPTYKYNVTNIKADSCVPGENFNLGEFYDVGLGPDSRNVCSIFKPYGEIRVDIELGIPYNSNTGNLSDTFYLIFNQV